MIERFENISLLPYNSFGVNARAAQMITFTTGAELAEILSGEPGILSGRWNILGGGNNILFTRDYDGTLLHPAGGAIEVTGEDADHVYVRVEAGIVWDEFVEWSVERGLWGTENLSHIPSLAGAAPVQNIGAYGAEVKDITVSVEALDVFSLKSITIAAGHCGFGYRDSIFKHSLKGKAVITAVNLRLGKRPRPVLTYGALAVETEQLGELTPRNIRRAVVGIRKSKLPEPSDTGNAGSFFKNPVVDASVAGKLRNEHPGMPEYPAGDAEKVKLSAGWLIEKAGWKGAVRGRAGVYPKQALILINTGGATGIEIAALAGEIQADVRNKFGIAIEAEVNIW